MLNRFNFRIKIFLRELQKKAKILFKISLNKQPPTSILPSKMSKVLDMKLERALQEYQATSEVEILRQRTRIEATQIFDQPTANDVSVDFCVE